MGAERTTVETVRWPGTAGMQSAGWLSANERPAPRRIVEVDDRLTADQAITHASQGVGMLWRGDYHNAKQLVSAVDRRLAKRSKAAGRGRAAAPVPAADTTHTADEFYRLRQARAQRSRVLSLVLLPVDVSEATAGADRITVPLPRAPRVSDAVTFGYERESRLAPGGYLVSGQELGGVLSAHQWYLNGVDVPSLGDRIHPHYGTFLPTRHEYVDLVAAAPLPAGGLAFDIGTGTGVLAAVLARRGIERVVGTDIHQRAVDCANENFARLGISDRAEARLGSMFPEGRASLIVCNPPWLPGSAPTTLDAAVYDPGSAMLRSFLAGLPDHLDEGGEGWLVISDLAELLGLRGRDMLQGAFAEAGLEVVDRLDIAPTHARAADTDDVLHAARSREVTSLWRLRVAGAVRTPEPESVAG